MTYSAILPLKITIPMVRVKDKSYWLNMNQYHIWHHQVRNNLKQMFKPIDFQSWDFKASRIKLSYFVERETKRKYDTMNYVSLIDKFFLDWLQKKGLLVDDSFDRVSYGSIDGINECKDSICKVKIEILAVDI